MGVARGSSQGETLHRRLAIVYKFVHLCWHWGMPVETTSDSHSGNCRDFQIIGNFDHKLALLLPQQAEKEGPRWNARLLQA